MTQLREFTRDGLAELLARLTGDEFAGDDVEKQKRVVATCIERFDELDKYQVWAALQKARIEIPVVNGKGKRKKKEPRTQRATLPDAVRVLRSSEWNCLAYNERTTELVFTKKPPCDTAHKGFPAAVVDADFTSIVSAFDAQEEQRQRFRASTWLEPIEQYAADRFEEDGHVTVAGILSDVMDLELGRQDQRSQNEAARCLQHLGWHRMQKRVGPPGKKRRQWVYEPSPDTTTPPVSDGTSGDE